MNASVVEIWIMLGMGALGYVLRKLDFETAPVVLGLILAPMIEVSLRQSLSMSAGSYAIFTARPLAATLLAAALALLLLGLRPLLRRGPGVGGPGLGSDPGGTPGATAGA